MPGGLRNQGLAGARQGPRLAQFTTLRLGGPARRLVEAGTADELAGEVRSADERREPLLVLGGGSNLVIADEGFPGTVIRIATRGITPTREATGDGVAVRAAAGEDWDAVVAWSVAEGLAGLECLSGIPGQAGATPIQNVGAYGQEVAATVTTVRAWDRARGVVATLSGQDCAFGYRDSAFKRGDFRGRLAGPAGHDQDGSGRGLPFTRSTGRFVVLDVTFRLTRSRLSLPVRYRELAASLGVPEGGRAPLAVVRAAVLGLRRSKGMLLDPADPDTRSAGSFFINPVLGADQFAALQRRVRHRWGGGVRVPAFPVDGGGVKVPAAWLIERAGFGKGYQGSVPAPPDGARISAKHTLALVNPGGATTVGLLRLAREIRDGVAGTFGVNLACEPVLVGVQL